MKIGVLSDTHGLLRTSALNALDGCDHIIQAGDIGTPAIVDQLRALASLSVVRGNADKGAWTMTLPDTEVMEVGEQLIFILHDLETLDVDPVSAGIGAIIHGHTHRPEQRRRDGVLYLNPGSAGPVRGTLPICMAILRIHDEWSVEHIILDQPVIS